MGLRKRREIRVGFPDCSSNYSNIYYYSYSLLFIPFKQEERVLTMNKHHPGQSERGRKIRSDKGKRFLSNRDLKVLRWIAEQHGITLDHLHTLLSRDPGANAPYANFISMGAVRMEVARWLAAGWIEKEKSTIEGTNLDLAHQYLCREIAPTLPGTCVV